MNNNKKAVTFYIKNNTFRIEIILKLKKHRSKITNVGLGVFLYNILQKNTNI